MNARLALFLAILVFASAWGRPTPAQAQALPDSLQRYRAEMIDIRIRAFGFGGYQLYKGGVEYEGGYDELFAASSAAMEELDTYQTLMTTGGILFFSGIAVAVAGIIVIPLDSKGDSISGVGLGLAIGGIAVELTGGIIMSVGRLHINDAVTAYNDDLYERIHKGAAEAPVALKVSGSL